MQPCVHCAGTERQVPEEAQAYVEQMKADKRYKRDVY